MRVHPFILALCIAACGVGPTSAHAAPPAGPPAALGAALDAALAREQAAGRFTGVVLVGRGDALVYERAFGLADRERRRSHRADERWRWASVSKQVAAVLAMQLVEAGQLSLDDRVDRLLPSFPSPQAGAITLRHLLQHTSGLPNPDDTPPQGVGDRAVPAFYMARHADAGGAMRAALGFCAGPVRGPAGERFAYNNCDTWVLQAVLERATGLPYERLVAQRLTAPLGLTSLALAPAAPVPHGEPVGYLANGEREPDIQLRSFGAGGALLGTAQDLWRFDRALMQGRLLGPQALKTLWQGEPQLGYVALGAWSFPAQLPGCAAPVDLVERRGQIGGVQVRNLLAPALGAALIVFSNTAATDFGEIWQGQGLTYTLAGAAFCSAAADRSLGG